MIRPAGTLVTEALEPSAIAEFGVEPGWGFGIRHRVRWSEVDPFAHANHAAYLEWFEAARNRYFEIVGLPLRSASSPGPVMVRLEVDYRKPLGYGDRVLVTARTRSMRQTSLTMEYAVWRDGLVAACTARLVIMVNATGERVPIPPGVREAIVARDGARQE